MVEVKKQQKKMSWRKKLGTKKNGVITRRGDEDRHKIWIERKLTKSTVR